MAEKGLKETSHTEQYKSTVIASLLFFLFYPTGRPVTYIQFGSHLPKKYKIRIHCQPNKQCAFNGDLKSDYVFKQIKPALGSELVQPQFREKSSSFESAKFPKHYLMLTKEGGRMKIFLRKVDMSSKKQSK